MPPPEMRSTTPTIASDLVVRAQAERPRARARRAGRSARPGPGSWPWRPGCFAMQAPADHVTRAIPRCRTDADTVDTGHGARCAGRGRVPGRHRADPERPPPRVRRRERRQRRGRAGPAGAAHPAGDVLRCGPPRGDGHRLPRARRASTLACDPSARAAHLHGARRRSGRRAPRSTSSTSTGGCCRWTRRRGPAGRAHLLPGGGAAARCRRRARPARPAAGALDDHLRRQRPAHRHRHRT